MLTRFRGHRPLGALVPGKDVHTPKTCPPDPPEFRTEAVRMARSGGVTIPQLARDLGIAPQTLRNWVGQANVDDGLTEGLTSAEREELRHLCREVRVLRDEREILKEATAFFARETGRRR